MQHAKCQSVGLPHNDWKHGLQTMTNFHREVADNLMNEIAKHSLGIFAMGRKFLKPRRNNGLPG